MLSSIKIYSQTVIVTLRAVVETGGLLEQSRSGHRSPRAGLVS